MDELYQIAGKQTIKLESEDPSEEIIRRKKRAKGLIEEEKTGKLEVNTTRDEELKEERKKEAMQFSTLERAKLGDISKFRFIKRAYLKHKYTKAHEQSFERDEALRKERKDRDLAIQERRDTNTNDRLKVWITAWLNPIGTKIEKQINEDKGLLTDEDTERKEKIKAAENVYEMLKHINGSLIELVGKNDKMITELPEKTPVEPTETADTTATEGSHDEEDEEHNDDQTQQLTQATDVVTSSQQPTDIPQTNPTALSSQQPGVPPQPTGNDTTGGTNTGGAPTGGGSSGNLTETLDDSQDTEDDSSGNPTDSEQPATKPLEIPKTKIASFDDYAKAVKDTKEWLDKILESEIEVLDPASRDALERMRLAFDGAEKKIEKVYNKAVEKGELITFTTVLNRSMSFKDMDGFTPDYSNIGENNKMNGILNLRYKHPKEMKLSTTPEQFKTLVEDAFGGENAVTKALAEANRDNEIVRFFVHGLSIAYRVFKDYRMARRMQEANDCYAAIAGRFVETIKELYDIDLSGYMNEYDKSLYYLIVNFGENLKEGTAKLHAETLGYMEKEANEEAEKVSENLFDTAGLFGTEEEIRKKNKAATLENNFKGRFFKRSEISKILREYETIVHIEMSKECAKKICMIESMESLMGYERKPETLDSFRFGLGKKEQLRLIKKEKKEEGKDEKEKKDDKTLEDDYIKMTEITLVLNDVIAPEITWSPIKPSEKKKDEDHKESQTDSPNDKSKESSKDGESSKQGKPMKLPSFVVEEGMKEKLRLMVREEKDYKKLKAMFIPESASESVKARLEPTFARVLLFIIPFFDNKNDRRLFFLQDDALSMVEKYYPDAVDIVKEEIIPKTKTTDDIPDKVKPIMKDVKVLNVSIPTDQEMFIERRPEDAVGDVSTYAGKIYLSIYSELDELNKGREFSLMETNMLLSLPTVE